MDRMIPTDRNEIKRVALRLYDIFFDADLSGRAAQVAFYFAFALFPFIYFITSLFGLIVESSDTLQDQMFAYLVRILPDSVFELVQATIGEVISASSGTKLTFSLIVTLWVASNGVDSVRTSLNAIYELTDTRSFYRTKAESIALTIILAVLTLVSIGIVFYGWQIFQTAFAGAGVDLGPGLFLSVVQWIAIFALMLLVLEIFYNVLPDHKKFTWEWITLGSLVAMVIWIALTTGFRVYLLYFNTYSRTYGSLGAVIIMLLWMYLTALAILIGAAINVAIEKTRSDDRARSSVKDDS
jgi:membrane protein